MKLPAKKYAVIVADPPWSFKSWSEKGEGRSAKNHYEVMRTKDIAALPVSSIAAPDCALMLWAVMPQLPEALAVITAWGFKFKTVAFTWVKQNKRTSTLFYDTDDIFTGMGYYTRANCELCILATRGNPKRISSNVLQPILAPVREHSRKPDEAYKRIERLFAGPYIDLFSRECRENWDAWGKEVNKFRPKNARSKKRPQR